MALPTQMVGGLISGLDTSNIIKQLMTIESRPVTMLQSRIEEHKLKLEAYKAIDTLLQDFYASAKAVAKTDIWSAYSAASSDEATLSAAVTANAEPGTYAFRVLRLAQTGQYISGGFATRDKTPVAPTGGTIRIDSGRSRVNLGTKVSDLNGGKGIYHGAIRITDKSGASAMVDLAGAETVQDIIDAINAADGISVRASLNLDPATQTVAGDALVITDLSGGSGMLRVENYGGSTTADDLGIARSVAGSQITGNRIWYLGGDMHLSSLRDGLGINTGKAGTIRIRSGALDKNVDLSTANTVQDVLNLLNAVDPGISAGISASGRGLQISSTLGDLEITSVGAGNTTAEDLGIATSAPSPSPVVGLDLIADLDSVRILSLSGRNAAGISGTRVNPWQVLDNIEVQEDGGPTYTLDLSAVSGASSLADLVERLNQQAADQGVNLLFRINDIGNGIAVVNTSAATSYTFLAAGRTASDLGLEGSTVAASSVLNGGDLDRVYLSRATRLSTLNGGNGAAAGYIRITDAQGKIADLNLSGAQTLGEVIDIINTSGLAISARINDTGDGLLLEEDPDSGTGNDIRVEELYGGTTARDLGILGLGSGGSAGLSRLDGSFEKEITILATNTLIDVMNKIADAQAGVYTSIINDGSETAPYRLVVTAGRSGTAGDFILDTDIAGLRMRQGAAGKDALLLYGQPAPGVSPVLLASSTNSNNTAVLGMTLQLKRTSPNFTTLTVVRDTQKVEEGVQKMVDSYNSLQELAAQLDRYVSEEEKSQQSSDDATYIPPVLFGDAALRAMMREISDLFFNTVSTPQGLRTFYDAGITFDDKGKLVYDSAKFEDLLAADFDAACDLFILNRDVARKDLDAMANAAAAGNGTDVMNIINGDTSSNNFGPANGYESADSIPAGGLPVTIQFGSPRVLNRLAIYHIDSTAMPAAQYALKNFAVEYLDAATGKWETLRNVSNNTSAVNYLGFSAPTAVSALRITGYDTNHPFDKKMRLVEVEAYESQGLASRMEQVLSKLASSSQGFYAEQQTSVQEKIDDMQATIDKMNARLESVEESYLRQFAAMEAALAQMQTQSSYFQQQMDAWTYGNLRSR